MLRGCLLALLLYAALAVGYYFWFDTVLERPGSIYGALALGLVVFLCLGALTNARQAFRDWSLLAGSERGNAPRDGKLCAVAGKIYPVNQPLIAPFSGEECILCEYDLSRHRRRVNSSNDENTGSDFAGFLMVPSVVRGKHAEVRILGFPIIEGFGDTACTTYAAARRAIDYLTMREFESRTGLKMVTVLGVFEEVWSDEDGLVEKNIRLGTVSLPDLFPPELEAAIDQQIALEVAQAANPQPVVPTAGDLHDMADEEQREDDDDENFDDELDDNDTAEDEDDDGPERYSSPEIPRMTEKRVNIGNEVCAIGVYNEPRRGLLPPGRGRQPNRLFRGSAEDLIKVFRSKVFSHLFGGLLFLVLAHGVAYGVMQAYLHSPDLTRQRDQAAFEAAKQGDLARLTSLVRRGMDLNIRNEQGHTLLMETTEPAVADWLIERGVDINAADNNDETALMIAASDGRTEIVRRLIAAKAELNRKSSSYQRTALMDADRRNHPEVAALLRAAGAEDDVITAVNGEPLPADGGEPLAHVKEYLAAVHARDPATLSRLFVTGRNIDFYDTDWGLWHSCRPVEIAEWTGFIRGDDVTIWVSGITGGGYPARWNYQLRRMDGQWRITREEDDL